MRGWGLVGYLAVRQGPARNRTVREAGASAGHHRVLRQRWHARPRGPHDLAQCRHQRGNSQGCAGFFGCAPLVHTAHTTRTHASIARHRRFSGATRRSHHGTESHVHLGLPRSVTAHRHTQRTLQRAAAHRSASHAPQDLDRKRDGPCKSNSALGRRPWRGRGGSARARARARRHRGHTRASTVPLNQSNE